jgi:hypothetical protein
MDARPDDCDNCGESEDSCECDDSPDPDPSARNRFAVRVRPQDPDAAVRDLFATSVMRARQTREDSFYVPTPVPGTIETGYYPNGTQYAQWRDESGQWHTRLTGIRLANTA